jgi:transcriptional regulator with XRE-family HTH domain
VPPEPLPDRRALGKAVRELRHERAWTQETLAHQAGLHWTYIGGIERGERNPSWDNVVKLARGLGVSVSELAAQAEQLTH